MGAVTSAKCVICLFCQIVKPPPILTTGQGADGLCWTEWTKPMLDLSREGLDLYAVETARPQTAASRTTWPFSGAAICIASVTWAP